MKKKNEEEDPLTKLMKLTKIMKEEKVHVAPKGPPRASNKWRSQDPKFASKAPKPSDLVQAGGMEVDASRQEEYENWRKDKIEEANNRRALAERKAQAAKKARAEALKPAPEPEKEP